MRGSIIVKILLGLVLIAFGWTLGKVCEAHYLFTLDWSIGVSDVLAIIVEVVLAIFIVNVIENSAQNKRVEKDFYITELSDAQQLLADLEKKCSDTNPLSFSLTVYEVEKTKKNLLSMWKIMEERSRDFHKKQNKDFERIIANVKLLNSQLSDAEYFSSEEGFESVKISKGHIYLNKTVRSEIDNTFNAIKDGIFKLKIAINEM